MVTKELSESAVELNKILENCSEEVIKKIPHKFREFLKKIESKTYKFDYDNNKRLNEQILKPKTRRLLALIYTDYLCSADEKEEYLKKVEQFFEEEERLKKEKYDSNNLFKRKEPQNLQPLKKESIMKKIIRFIKKLIKIK